MTFTDFTLVVLAALAMHWIWNYESACDRLRRWVGKIPLIKKPLLCPACNAFWFGAVSTALFIFTHPAVLACLGSFGILLGLTRLYRIIPDLSKKLQLQKTDSKPVVKEKDPEPSVVQVPASPMKGAERTVIILTSLTDFRSSYSVAGDALNEARAIGMMNPTWDVQLWVQQGAKEGTWEFMPPNVCLRKLVPRVSWGKGEVSEPAVKLLSDFLHRELGKFPNATVITHDLLFVSWYASFAKAIHQFTGFAGIRWFHVAHSLPGDRAGKSEWLTTVPEGKHTIVTVAKGYEQKFAEYYNTTPDRVLHMPNIKDPRTWGSMSDDVRTIVTKTRLSSRDLVQIFPSCSTRLTAKGLNKVIQSFAILCDRKNAFLLICNPNARGEKPGQLIARMKALAEKVGLKPENYAFTSDLLPARATSGLSADDIKTLMHFYGNVMLWPSISEADSLVMLESRLTNQFIVANESVPTTHEFANCIVPWGKDHTDASPELLHFATNRVLDHFAVHPDKRRDVLKARNLEGVGSLWQGVIVASGP
jgi:hypothetical protein